MRLLRSSALMVLTLLLSVSAAHAQASRTWVSGVGDDANPCSRTAPCKTFAGAISKTAASGEINILDAGGFGALTITKSISIIGEGATAGILAAGTNGIVVNAATTDTVLLEGLDIEGFGSGLNGIRVLQAGNVTIRRCNIRGFTSLNSAGILVSGATATKVVVQDCTITHNDIGINVTPTAGPDANVLVERVHVSKSRIGVRATANANVRLSASSIVHNNNGLVFAGSGSIRSFGNNVVDGNTQAEVPTQTLLLK